MSEGANTKKASKPKYRAEFLKRLRVIWKTEWPFLSPAKSEVLPFDSDSVFTIPAELTQHKKFVHLWIWFGPRTPGEFTVEIFVHELEVVLNPLVTLMPGRYEDFPTGKNGRYRIGGPIGAPHGDWWWALKDNDGERIEIWRKLGTEENSEMLKRSVHKWMPSTYDQPFAGIVEEAITDLNRNLREKVFPLILKRAA